MVTITAGEWSRKAIHAGFGLFALSFRWLDWKSAAAIARPAARPSNSVLDTSKYEALTNRPIRHFREPLLEYLARRARPEA